MGNARDVAVDEADTETNKAAFASAHDSIHAQHVLEQTRKRVRRAQHSAAHEHGFKSVGETQNHYEFAIYCTFADGGSSADEWGLCYRRQSRRGPDPREHEGVLHRGACNDLGGKILACVKPNPGQLTWLLTPQWKRRALFGVARAEPRRRRARSCAEIALISRKKKQGKPVLPEPQTSNVNL